MWSSKHLVVKSSLIKKRCSPPKRNSYVNTIQCFEIKLSIRFFYFTYLRLLYPNASNKTRLAAIPHFILFRRYCSCKFLLQLTHLDFICCMSHFLYPIFWAAWSQSLGWVSPQNQPILKDFNLNHFLNNDEL